MSKVATAFVHWTWDTFDIIVRLNSETNGRNHGSRKVLEKAGFALEGCRENMICVEGEILDALMFGALRPGRS